MQSYIFDFRKNPNLMSKWNKEFDVESIGSETFYIVLVDDSCMDNFSECVTDGQLNYFDSQEHSLSEECELAYVIDGTAESIVLNNDVEFTFDGEGSNPSSFKMKGAFLVNDSGYALGYSINQFSVNITTQMIFEKGLVFFDVVEGGLSGE